MSFFNLAPQNGPIVNQYGVETHRLDNGRIVDWFSGYYTGAELRSDWQVYSGGLRTGIRLDPSTGRFTDR